MDFPKFLLISRHLSNVYLILSNSKNGSPPIKQTVET